jgi:hypothetical protein
MHALLSTIIGSLFVLLGSLNVWIMLTNRGSSKRASRLWIRVHSIVGYVFIGMEPEEGLSEDLKVQSYIFSRLLVELSLISNSMPEQNDQALQKVRLDCCRGQLAEQCRRMNRLNRASFAWRKDFISMFLESGGVM